ncbi:hypothetical protein COCVIDRAFT_12227 [Bipolaris victoriae FI3]|uniref:Uncharacterized protein n=1 Tax=Bipolaris victoriae (strain FI3) TaxID=930091 RepID=W7EM90_BIPV3|nr:hypothetical protein COCVIDRAFT_12227 [Bipolaris victoriae FI3]
MATAFPDQASSSMSNEHEQETSRRARPKAGAATGCVSAALPIARYSPPQLIGTRPAREAARRLQTPVLRPWVPYACCRYFLVHAESANHAYCYTLPPDYYMLLCLTKSFSQMPIPNPHVAQQTPHCCASTSTLLTLLVYFFHRHTHTHLASRQSTVTRYIGQIIVTSPSSPPAVSRAGRLPCHAMSRLIRASDGTKSPSISPSGNHCLLRLPGEQDHAQSSLACTPTSLTRATDHTPQLAKTPIGLWSHR